MTVRSLPAGVLAGLLLAVSPLLAAEPAAKTLRDEFLECEHQAASSLLPFADAARCSGVYEQLLRGEFKGDFARLLAWWRAERRRQAVTSSASPPQT